MAQQRALPHTCKAQQLHSGCAAACVASMQSVPRLCRWESPPAWPSR
jgi:hypothetical protein